MHGEFLLYVVSEGRVEPWITLRTSYLVNAENTEAHQGEWVSPRNSQFPPLGCSYKVTDRVTDVQFLFHGSVNLYSVLSPFITISVFSFP